MFKELKKYIWSLMDDDPILRIETFEDGEVIVRSQNGSGRTFFVDYDAEEVSADYILCSLQDEPSIKVSKYPLNTHINR